MFFQKKIPTPGREAMGGDVVKSYQTLITAIMNGGLGWLFTQIFLRRPLASSRLG